MKQAARKQHAESHQAAPEKLRERPFNHRTWKVTRDIRRPMNNKTKITVMNDDATPCTIEYQRRLSESTMRRLSMIDEFLSRVQPLRKKQMHDVHLQQNKTINIYLCSRHSTAGRDDRSFSLLLSSTRETSRRALDTKANRAMNRTATGIILP